MIQMPRYTYYYRSTAAVLELSDKRLTDLIGDIQDEFAAWIPTRDTGVMRPWPCRESQTRSQANEGTPIWH